MVLWEVAQRRTGGEEVEQVYVYLSLVCVCVFECVYVRTLYALYYTYAHSGQAEGGVE